MPGEPSVGSRQSADSRDLSAAGFRSTAHSRLSTLLRQLAGAVRSIAGMPDYRAYLAHARRCHPDRPTARRAGVLRRIPPGPVRRWPQPLLLMPSQFSRTLLRSFLQRPHRARARGAHGVPVRARLPLRGRLAAHPDSGRRLPRDGRTRDAAGLRHLHRGGAGRRRHGGPGLCPAPLRAAALHRPARRVRCLRGATRSALPSP